VWAQKKVRHKEVLHDQSGEFSCPLVRAFELRNALQLQPFLKLLIEDARLSKISACQHVATLKKQPD
jgi:hypothetical protein